MTIKIITKIKQIYKKNRLDLYLVNILKKYSRNKIQKIIKNKQIYINNFICTKSNKKIHKNDLIQITLKKKEKINKIKKKNIPLNIVYEDNHLIIINKKNGIIVHPGVENNKNTIMNSIIYHYPNIYKNIPRCGIVHRLDKNTTGLLIIAKEIKTYNILIEKIKNKKITRIYKTIVLGKTNKKGLINKPISRNKYNRTQMSINKKGKQAITYFKVLENFNFLTLLKVILNTGRTHQIRVHMKYIKHPILGEKTYTLKNQSIKKKIKKYISKETKQLNRQALHASTLIFTHPIIKTKLNISSPLPKDMNNLIFKLRLKKNKLKNQ